MADIGFHIVEAYPDGLVYITKHAKTGGMVNELKSVDEVIKDLIQQTM